MTANIVDLDFGEMQFPVEVIDEGEGEVLIFDNAEILAAFEEHESRGATFEHPKLRRRVLELRDQLLAITGELDIILQAA